MKRKLLTVVVITAVLLSCQNRARNEHSSRSDPGLAEQVKSEFIRSWESYKKYAWGHDVLMPISLRYKDWYEESLHISPIDAYTTMQVMGLALEPLRAGIHGL